MEDPTHLRRSVLRLDRVRSANLALTAPAERLTASSGTIADVVKLESAETSTAHARAGQDADGTAVAAIAGVAETVRRAADRVNERALRRADRGLSPSAMYAHESWKA